jgi:hypothetical protein
MFIDGWQPIVRIVVVGTFSYIAVVALLRYFGKRGAPARLLTAPRLWSVARDQAQAADLPEALIATSAHECTIRMD